MTSPTSALQPQRTIDELKELRALTGDADGAQRVAWTDTWVEAKDWLSGKVAPTGALAEVDEAGLSPAQRRAFDSRLQAVA